MSLVYCPECGHEISQNAIACPNCGLPLEGVDRTVVVEETPVVPPVVAAPIRREGLPPWAMAVFGVLAILTALILFLLFRNSGTDSNVNVALNANRRAMQNSQTSSSIPPTETTVPGSQVSIPSDVPSTTTVPGSTTSVPVAPGAERGKVVIRAKVVTARGGTQPARAAKFYLLDKDVETILSEARIEPIEGNSLTASLGLAAVFPDRYSEFQRAAMRALSAHAKHTGTTDGNGAASVANIAPDSYYLFAITRVGNGFAMWNSPISVVSGENLLDLSPASVTEIQTDSGE